MVYQFQPLENARWSDFLETQPQASVFHSVGWLAALHRTYGYEPIVFTPSPPDSPLENAIVACRVASWLTGPRLVSVPFADHSEPLVTDYNELEVFFSDFAERLQREGLRYVELRPIRSVEAHSARGHSTRTYWHHQLDLSPPSDTLFRNFHKSSIQRKILRAQREGLSYEEGQSEALLDTFYRLFVTTRRRHHIPPPPRSWFHNLIQCFPGTLKIRVARKGRHPIASILTIQYKDTLVYKYGCSDPQYHNLGGVHLLFWRSIEEAKQEGLRIFDLGRSDLEDTGLVTFKNRWGARQSELTYFRYLSATNSKRQSWSTPRRRIVRAMIPYLPNRVLIGIGTILYKHAG